MKPLGKKIHHGFVLLEALVAMLVLSFGMLAVAGFQTTLSLNSDVAKQRTEATRLAQQKLEELRTFENMTVYASKMVSGNDAITTNASFARSWTVTSAAAVDSGRSIAVTAAWTDRAGDAQQVQLFSYIAKMDPATMAGLLFPSANGSNVRQPKNRSVDIPIPAISISGTNKSYAPWAGSSGGFLVFSDTSGDVVQKCTSEPTADSLSTDNCSTAAGYLLSGYITGGSASLVTRIVTPFSSAAYISGTPECYVQAAINQNSGTTIANTKQYTCLITPTDHDNDSATARVWSGRVDLRGATGASLAGTYTCRFSTDANTTDNSKHPAIYSLVDTSLSNQNFYISSSACANSEERRVAHLTNVAPSQYTVTYNGNSHTGGTVPATATYYSGDTVTVTAATLTKTGATFAGWNTASGGTGTSYAAGATFAIAANTTLYAQWTTSTPATYTVTYNGNGNTGGTAPATASYTSGATVTVQPAGTLTKTGATFAGWNTAAGGTGASYAAGASFAITANTTLYAKWTAIASTLGTPAPVWPAGTSNVSLSWPAIPNATGYIVKTCTSAGCTPDTVRPTQTDLTYAPGTISNGAWVCINVVATNTSGTYLNSAASVTKCVSRSGGTYTHN
ncbi:MAG: InlB B-repeat-containing protein [Pseudomonadota bacterium]|nr:InlB B-repeat-containing protein [Pseudomonadota bacterium]